MLSSRAGLALLLSLIACSERAAEQSSEGSKTPEVVRAVSSADRPGQTLAELRAYWTAERRAAAKPMRMTRAATATPCNSVATGDEVAFAPGLLSTWAHQPNPSDATQVPHTEYFPYSTAGKVFFKKDGLDRVCSAAAIGNTLYLTAAHCLFWNGKFNSDFLFEPQYQPVDPPYSFSSASAWVPSKWTIGNAECTESEKGDDCPWQYDYGLVRTDEGMKELLGTLGILISAGPDQEWTALGYPQDPNYDDGNVMYEATGGWDSNASSASSGCVAMENNYMPGGASGGPWIVKGSGGVFGYVNGVNSWHYVDDETGEILSTMYSPVFGDDFKDFYDYVRGMD